MAELDFEDLCRDYPDFFPRPPLAELIRRLGVLIQRDRILLRKDSAPSDTATPEEIQNFEDEFSATQSEAAYQLEPEFPSPVPHEREAEPPPIASPREQEPVVAVAAPAPREPLVMLPLSEPRERGPPVVVAAPAPREREPPPIPEPQERGLPVVVQPRPVPQAREPAAVPQLVQRVREPFLAKPLEPGEVTSAKELLEVESVKKEDSYLQEGSALQQGESKRRAMKDLRWVIDEKWVARCYNFSGLLWEEVQLNEEAFTSRGETRDIWEKRFERREQQITIGKVTAAYNKWRLKWAKLGRAEEGEPVTPRVTAFLSKSSWEQTYSTWRIMIHNSPGEEAEVGKEEPRELLGNSTKRMRQPTKSVEVECSAVAQLPLPEPCYNTKRPQLSLAAPPFVPAPEPCYDLKRPQLGEPALHPKLYPVGRVL